LRGLGSYDSESKGHSSHSDRLGGYSNHGNNRPRGHGSHGGSRPRGCGSHESLSFHHVNKEVHEKILELFKDGHSSISVMYTYKDTLYLNVIYKQEFLLLLTNWIINSDYNYIAKLFQNYHEMALSDHNSISIFKHLVKM
ncbi:8400_t:CDS:2, partial [Funneliformis caledonium]